MNSESIIVECAALAVEVCVFGLVYKLYKTNSACLKSLKAAQCFEIDNELKENVENNNGVVEYAVVSGKIKALTAPLRSQYIPYLQGVIREKITKEHKVKWNPFLRIWSDTSNDLHHSVNYVPFALCSKTSSLFKKQIMVEVLDPLSAEELILPSVFDDFSSYNDTIGDTVFGYFRGERTIGLQQVEKMLCEDEILTAVGKLLIEDNKLKIKPPDNGLTYFLTSLNLKSLVNKISFSTSVFKSMSILMGTLSFATLVYISRHAYSKIKRRLIRNRERKQWEMQRKLRRMADRSRNVEDSNGPKCVICLDNPVEILILECGHACLCYDCSDNIGSTCPVCRNPVERTVPAFLP